jgi:ribosome maturation factor RimP
MIWLTHRKWVRPAFLILRSRSMAETRQIVDQITRLVEPIVRDELLELVEVEFYSTGGQWLLRIYIDKEGGVTISDCERVSREVGRTLDVEGIIDDPYRLEVSSPGLTRALKKRSDFERYKGRPCKIITSSLLESRNEFRGEIAEVTEEGVEIKAKTGAKMDIHKIPFCAIKKAHLEFEL